jgi:hydrogenase expression/formation protein HypC
MCIGIPMQVVSVTEGGAIASRRGERHALNTMLIDTPRTGDWVLAFQGSAVRVLSADEAERTDAALQALEAALAGASRFETYFDDLIAREPELPSHLRNRP